MALANGPSATAHFSGSLKIISDHSSGRLYVSDQANFVVRVIQPNGSKSQCPLSFVPSALSSSPTHPQLSSCLTSAAVGTLAGSPGVSGYADGLNALFTFPNDVALVRIVLIN